MKAKIIGSGLSGITSAILLKNKGYDVEIYETRNHIGGNCYDSNVCGNLVHNYGPHIYGAGYCNFLFNCLIGRETC